MEFEEIIHNILNILAIILLNVAVIIALLLILRLLSLIYLHTNKERLRKDNKLIKQIQSKFQKALDNDETYNQAIEDLNFNKTIKCSSATIQNVEISPIKYIQKHANIQNNLPCIERIDYIKEYLENIESLNEIIDELYRKTKKKTFLIFRPFIKRKHVIKALCNIKLSQINDKQPYLYFIYISPAGNTSRDYEIKINAEMATTLEEEISSKITKSGHSKTQRSAMTNDLREAIKLRDNYTCQICGNSVYEEPNLLLEVDHIIPVSKGGETKAENLQTLCWRCNRNKGDKEE